MSTLNRSVFALAALSLLGLSSCKTVDTPASTGKVTVSGTLFYPDGEGVTYVVPAGAEIVGSAGKKCTFIVQSGGKLSAHTGEGNVFKIQSGGSFQGFAHPATNCQVIFERGALVSREQTGPGTTFVPK